MSRDFHNCSNGVGRLRAQVDDKAVCKLASSLNDGKPCVIEYLLKAVGLDSLTGCANYYASIRFNNGSLSWLMRVLRVLGFAIGLPVTLAEYLICSEYATLKFLETTKGDTTKVYQGLAEIYAELEKHPFTEAGSFYVEFPDD
ncbi:hypothetical protein LZ30DRAFT_775110 [Colletotrichum cereale]|nr:hypothetical protein LZ30DRAFT_775110 [Colletotrichum cereale]